MSVMLLLAISGLSSAVMIPVMYSQRNAGMRGIEMWCYGNVLVFFALLAYILRLMTPAFIYVMMANTLLITGIICFQIGLRQFFNLPLYKSLYVAIPLVVAAGSFVFTFFWDSMTARILIISGLTSVMVGWGGVTIWQMRPKGRTSVAHYFACGAAMWIAFWHGLRCVVHATGLESLSNLADPTTWNLLFFAVTGCSLPAYSLGLILLIQDRIMGVMRKALTFDDLTGAWSRRSFLAECDREFTDMAGNNGIATVLYLDIDRFKQINDQLGHAGGDLALQHFVRIVDQCIREDDRLGRLGGEEFAVLLSDTGPQEAMSMAEEICRAVRDNPVKSGKGATRMTVSIGVATARPGEAVLSVMTRADGACYEAKLAGRDCVKIADRDLPLSMMTGMNVAATVEAVEKRWPRKISTVSRPKVA